jgi:hypothetical protein
MPAISKAILIKVNFFKSPYATTLLFVVYLRCGTNLNAFNACPDAKKNEGLPKEKRIK